MRYQGKTVLITGAAGGFGRLAAEMFAAEGALLCLADLDREAVTAVAARLGGDVIAEACDVSQEGQVAALVAVVMAQFGRLDVAINNAGIGQSFTKLTELDLATFDRLMAVNARGVFLGMKHQLPPMLAAKTGAILNVASAAGLVGAGMLSGYAASKHAVVGLTKAAADEVARHNVRVNALCPSFAATPLFDEMADDLAGARGESREDAYARIAARVPMRRVAAPEEVARAMLWLCAPENSFMTGQAVAVDGGLTAV
ncbi:MAG: glucose 1-dehydrogenase [Rhodobacteraceae bacterium]|nr:glucose 1-dehydrogenase [Paracoccaceae bacterium]